MIDKKFIEDNLKEVNEKDELRAFQSPVRGEEIMKECGLKSGSIVGKIKKDIEEKISGLKKPRKAMTLKKSKIIRGTFSSSSKSRSRAL